MLTPQLSSVDPISPSYLRRSMLRGSGWAVLLRWGIRLTGLASTLVLARLLTPGDFGVVAIAMLVVGTIEVFSQTGHASALIRHPDPQREHYDTAWTLAIVVGLALAGAIMLVAPLTEIYFREPRATLVMQFLALRAALGGMENIGVVTFERNLQFQRIFQIGLYSKLFSLFVTLTLAVALRTYWALVAGILAGQLARTAQTYWVSSYRPRLSIAKAREIWAFSLWALLKNIGVYMNAQLDQFAVGGFAGAAAMGQYNVAEDVASSPTDELNGPIVSTLFPVMAKAQGDLEHRKQLYLEVLYWTALICFATSIGVALVSHDMIELLLGEQWIALATFMPWLALAAGLFGLTSSVYSSFDVIGRPRRAAALQWTRVGGMAVAVLIAAVHWSTLEAVAIARFLVALMMAPSLLFALARGLGIPFRDVIVTLWRPLLAASVMAGAVLSINEVFGLTGPARLLSDVVIGAVVYCAALMIMWISIGRPPGPEATLYNRVVRSLGHARP